jgi:extracellular factor (EF) 3-hydroxypalmitic acid methyl ester biosynthesis protein
MFHLAGEMSELSKGNGNGNGAGGVLPKTGKRIAPAPPAAPRSDVRESRVNFHAIDGLELRGVLVRVTRHHVVFELYNPLVVPRLSEVLQKFEITLQGRAVYSGPAVVHNLVDVGSQIICEATLDEAHWTDLNQILALRQEGQVLKEFKTFLKDWQKFYTIAPEFKVVIADMQTYLHDLRQWLGQLELKMQASTASERTQMERDMIDQLAGPIIQGIDVFIERFESIAAGLDADLQPAYRAYLRRQLHPFVLVSPFADRAFHKPMGYPGDYQTVDMMLRPPYEGSTLFAKVINVWLLGQLPTQAHRNRIKCLTDRLKLETYRIARAGRKARVFNFACGPAIEVQRFLADFHSGEKAELTLADFNQETLDHIATRIKRLQERLALDASVQFQRRSVYQILKESAGRSGKKPEYDFVYCAGLFDYLPDTTCKQLMEVFYNWLAPGGLLLATNATDALNDSRPFRFSMEYLLDWHLIYRNKEQLTNVIPDAADREYVNVVAESVGANLFLEIRKPDHA